MHPPKKKKIQNHFICYCLLTTKLSFNMKIVENTGATGERDQNSDDSCVLCVSVF